MELSWGQELWDNYDVVDKHVQHGIEFLEKYMKFTKERCQIEMDYAKMLRRLVKSYTPKKKDDDYAKFSTQKAFASQLSELNDIAGQHEIIAETMQTEIVRDIHDYSIELKTDKKKTHQEGKQMQAHLEASERNLDQVKRKFEKEWRESERAQLYYEKLDADANVTKAEVEKAKASLQIKKDIVEQCKGDYASVLLNFNKEQTSHYNERMPKVFEDYRRLDERRIKKTAFSMEQFSIAHSKVFPIIEKCIQGMKSSARAVDSDLDSRLVVEKYKSGFLPPAEKEFEDYTSPHSNTNVEQTSGVSPRNSISAAPKVQNKKGLSWLFGGKKTLESADYSHLPPEQRRKKLNKILDDLRQQHLKQVDGRKALIKMQEVYRKTPQLGDPASLDQQMRVSTETIDKLEADIRQHEDWLKQCTANVNRLSGSHMTTSSYKGGNYPTSSPAHSNNNLHVPSHAEAAPSYHEQTFHDDFEDEDSLEPVGTCKALYSFEATSEGAMSMNEGDSLLVLEKDKGDGWTRVLKNNIDGYVPSSYLDVKLY